jgi:hypothetical protein
VSDIVAERGHADDSAPVRLIHRCLGDDRANGTIMEIVRFGDDIINAAC